MVVVVELVLVFFLFLLVGVVLLESVFRQRQQSKEFLEIVEGFEPEVSVHVRDLEFLGVVDADGDDDENEFGDEVAHLRDGHVVLEVLVENEVRVLEVEIFRGSARNEFLQLIRAAFVREVDYDFTFLLDFGDLEFLDFALVAFSAAIFVFFIFLVAVARVGVFALFQQPELTTHQRIVRLKRVDGIAGRRRLEIAIGFLRATIFFSRGCWVLVWTMSFFRMRIAKERDRNEGGVLEEGRITSANFLRVSMMSELSFLIFLLMATMDLLLAAESFCLSSEGKFLILSSRR